MHHKRNDSFAPTPESDRLEVFVDGHCPFCRWFQEKIQPFDRNQKLLFLDLNNPAASRYSAARTPQQFSKEIHVFHADGKCSVGFYAWIEILKALPKLKWLGVLFSLAPFRWTGPSIYRWIARHRYQILSEPSRPASSSPTSKHIG